MAGLCHALLGGCTPPEYQFDEQSTAGTAQGGSAGSGATAGAGGSQATPTCRDGLLNQDETDIDCGGMLCNRCEAGQDCEIGDDCEDFVCTNRTCVLHTCSDGVLNGLETDVDCGGDCGPCGAGGAGGGDSGAGGDGGGPNGECEVDGDCNDTDVCTDDTCVNFTCENTYNTAPCATDNINCTVDVCSDGICTHEPDASCACDVDTDCNDGNVCTDETCVDHLCVPMSNADPCGSDNIACTVDLCSGGICTHEPDGSCECEIDADCDDVNLCTDDTCVDYACEILSNNDPCGSDSIDCTVDVCSDSSCSHQPDGSCECLIDADCDDVNLCTNDTCVGHACQNSNNTAPCATDNIACTTDVCGAGNCGHQPDGSCECLIDTDCDDSNPCTNDTCVGHACQNSNNSDPCGSDGIACTTDVCSAGACTHPPGGSCECLVDTDCDDADVCTNNACVNYACQATNNSDPCGSDGIACTNDVCSGGICTHPPGVCECLIPSHCNDGNPCTDDLCVDYACQNPNNTIACASDGITCTVDVCDSGACTHDTQACTCTGPAECDDSNPCTTDACVNFACQISNNTDPCGSDGIDCTTDVCSAGSCTHPPGGSCECLTDGHCDDSNVCTDEVCVDYACVISNNTDPCSSDGITCTNDVCNAGACTNEPGVSCECLIDGDCDDANACTDNACVDYACEDSNNSDACTSDGIACTTDVCSGGGCTHPPTGSCQCLGPANCNDANTCTDDACVDYACVNTNNASACATDGIACTTDVCDLGACTHPPTGSCECLIDATCDDTNVCTDDACVDYACENANNIDPCATDGIACTADVCDLSVCTHEPTDLCECQGPGSCDDTNVCTDDTCVDYACVFSNNSSGCASDDIACTTDVCDTGSCTHPPTQSCECVIDGECDDANACTDNACVDYACEDSNNNDVCAPEDADAIACTDDLCSGGTCTHVPTASCGCTVPADCNDNNVCTTDSCTDFACAYVNNANSCASDGNECTDDVCSAGGCTHPNRTGACTDDGDTCTSDQCSSGACTHTDTGRCNASNFVRIRTNRDSQYVVVDFSDPVWTLNRYIIGAGGSMGTVTVNWDATNLYVLFNILDATPNNGSAALWQDDSVELYLDMNNGKTTTYQGDDYQLTFGRDITLVSPDIQGNENAIEGPGFINVTTSTSNASGYTIGVTIAWAALDGASAPLDRNIGIDFGVNNDTDGGDSREAQLMVYGTINNHLNTSAFGTLMPNSGTLKWTGDLPANGAVFEKIDEVGERFILREDASGLYVALDGSDNLGLVTNEADATVFEGEACGAAPYIGLRAAHDLDGADWVSAEGGDVLTASQGTCTPASATSWEKFQLHPVTDNCGVPADCDDTNPCTTETCTGGFCAFTDTSAACVSDANSCTADSCITGTCTHLQTGTCENTGSSLLTIFADKNDRYVVVTGTNYLENTATTIGAATVFERVNSHGSLFRLRADVSGLFVGMGANDQLIADTNFAGATVFDSFDCAAPMIGLEATTDDDYVRMVTAEDVPSPNRLVVDRGSCAGAWERFRFFTQ